MVNKSASSDNPQTQENLSLQSMTSGLSRCMQKDRFALKRDLARLKKQPANQKLRARVVQRFERSSNQYQLRASQCPSPKFDSQLPVVQHLEAIASAIDKHQVVVIAGETGSGKTTQIPKLCLQLGRGVAGLIGHTQPRRLAARSVASRIAEELESPLGQVVGYKVRFGDHVSERSYIKLMTDGILLNETQSDRFLDAYDTLIIDEAHERSLNIDFILGYLKRILPKRPDLKVIITSATIDTERFAEYFDAPVFEVSGRTYPVEVRYRPLQDPFAAQEGEKPARDQNQAIVEAVDELSREGPGDILVFLSGERDIREAAEALRKHHPQQTEILPLYARLSASEQQRVFQPHGGRRIVLATNVAETSLTVPGIRYVVDTGYARISRYSVRSKIQRLPVEKIAQASARQRSGRCGRVAEGIAIRLFDEEDFNQRPAFTEPEILRTNLAQVILQMQYLRLGDVAEFPFIQPPLPKQINDGYLLLEALGAVDSDRRITALGKRLARLPIDPRIGRMLLEAEKFGTLNEVLIIASALSTQEVRERPVEFQQAADEKHQQFAHPQSDFIAYLNLWYVLEQRRKHLSNNQLRKYCKQNFLSYMRMREWRDIHQQLFTQVKELGLKVNDFHFDTEKGNEQYNYAAIHQALMSGLLSQLAVKEEDGVYQGARNIRLMIFPGSNLSKKQPRWIMAGEIVETSRVFARTVAAIEPEWIEAQAAHLLKHHYFEPFYERKRATVSAYDRLTLYGLIIHPKKKVNYGRIDAEAAREVFIREALVGGKFSCGAAFEKHNQQLIKDIEKLEDKSRRRDILVDELALIEFFQQRLPDDIYSGKAFNGWRKKAEKENPNILFMSQDSIMRHDAEHVTDELYPASMRLRDMQLPLEYHFLPGHPLDGVTVRLPLAVLNQVTSSDFDWLVPGLIREKLTLLLKSLPKSIRRQLVPVPETVTAFLQWVSEQGDLRQQLNDFVYEKKRLRISDDEWQQVALPEHLLMNYRLLDSDGEELASSRNLGELQQRFGKQAENVKLSSTRSPWERGGITHWDFGELPMQVEVSKHGMDFTLYPALTIEGDRQDELSIKLFDTQQRALLAHRQGVLMLLKLELSQQLAQWEKQIPQVEQLCLHYASLGKCQVLKKELVEASMREAFKLETPPRDEAAYKACKAAGETRMQDVLKERAHLLSQILSAYHQLAKQLKGNVPFQLVNVYQDVQQQLKHLVYPGFVLDTPERWLRRLPKYLKAIMLRLEKVAADPRRDALMLADYQKLNKLFWEKQGKMPLSSLSDDWLDYRFQLEEFKLSLTAQELKTLNPVSYKRLHKQWQALVEGA